MTEGPDRPLPPEEPAGPPTMLQRIRALLPLFAAIQFLNALAFFVGQYLAFRSGVHVSLLESTGPSIIRWSGQYARVSPEVFLYARIHLWITMIMIALNVPAIFIKRKTGNQW